MKYALLDTTNGSYNAVIAAQKAAFDKKPGATNFVPILNLDGTQALIQVHDDTNLPPPCVLDSNFDPSTRDMSLWEIPDPKS